MHGEILVAEIANIDGVGAIMCELVGGGAADAGGGVGACYYHHFILHSPAHRTSTSALLSVNKDQLKKRNGNRVDVTVQ